MSEPLTITEDLRGELVELFTERHRAALAPASAFAVGCQAQPALVSCLGEIDTSGSLAQPTTAFRIASCTKSFTATLILQLRDEAMLSLDDLASRYVPQVAAFHLPHAHSAAPTLRMLLSMSAGLASDNEWADRQESMSPDDFDALLSRGVSFVSEPGTGFEYSNLGFAILGRVAERITGTDYCELVRTRILAPLGLNSTDFQAPALAKSVAMGFAPQGDTFEPLPTSSPGAFSAIGGLFSTLDDLAVWSHWLCSAFTENPVRPDVLSPASRREMQQLHRLITTDSSGGPARGYGFGLFVEDDPELGLVISHSGGYPGFSSHMRWHLASGWYAVGLENATYAVVQQPVAAALALVLSTNNATNDAGTCLPWPATLNAVAQVNQLVSQWDDCLCMEIFADNVAMDKSLLRRQQELSALLELTGPLNFAASTSGTSLTPAQRSWTVPGTRGDLLCELLMNPLDPPLIQKLSFSIAGPEQTSQRAKAVG